MKTGICFFTLLLLACSHPNKPFSTLPLVGTWDNTGNPNNECDSVSFEFNADYSYYGTIVPAAYQPTYAPGTNHIICVKTGPNQINSSWRTNADTIYFQPAEYTTISNFNWKLSELSDTLYLRNIGLNESGYHIYKRRK
jgi:hypothetical protein